MPITASLRRPVLPLLALLTVLAAPPASAALPDFAGPGVPTIAPMLEKVTPAVVNISVHGRVREQNPLANDPFFRQFFNMPQQVEREVHATGSGVIVDAAHGYILTNNHVVAHADQIDVTTTDNRRFHAVLVGTDVPTDIAVLHIEDGKLTALPMADSDNTRVGDFVVAIGNPFGLGQTVTSGIVSAVGRSGLGIEGYEDFIQTDASINPGNSGGALVDMRGQLIGINTAILAPGGGNIGIGFAVPINMAKAVMEQIVRHGSVQRGRIGIASQDLTPEIAAALGSDRLDGVVIAGVEPGSPAARAGVRQGDILVAIDGVAVRGATQVRNRVALTPVGDDVELTLERGGDSRTVKVRVEPAPPEAQGRPRE